jgi:hypothetical protein
MNKTLLFACAAGFLLLPIQAYGGGGQSPTGEVGGGYALLHDPDVSGNLPTGWFVTAGTRLGIGKLRKDWFGVAGELTANYKTVSPLGFAISFRSYSLMGG